jgi:hypothetical protein
MQCYTPIYKSVFSTKCRLIGGLDMTCLFGCYSKLSMTWLLTRQALGRVTNSLFRLNFRVEEATFRDQSKKHLHV